MALVLDVDKAVRADKATMANGVEVPLTTEQKRQVVMTKYVSTDPMKADWQPAGEWFEQVTADLPGRRARLSVKGRDGDRGLMVDDGLVVDLIGTTERTVGIVPGQPPMDEGQIDEYEEVNQKPVPVFEEWQFRVRKVVLTSGPEDRAALSKSEDIKRASAQTDMFEAIKQAFQEGLGVMRAQGETAPSAQDTLEAGMKRK